MSSLFSCPAGLRELCFAASEAVPLGNLHRVASIHRHRVVGAQKRTITIQQLDEAKNGRERVVVLGSGWAGYTLARELSAKRYQTVLVSPRSYFVFTPLLASTSVGTLEFRTALEPLRSRSSRYDYIQGRAEAVDFGVKEVKVRETVRDPNQGLLTSRAGEDGPDARPLEMRLEASRGELFSLPYDKLVIAVGSYSQTFNIPGVKENAMFLKDVQDARKIRNKLLSCFETANLPTTSVSLKKQLLNFAIVGGGPTGIEFSGELRDIIREDMSRLYPQLMEHVNITVYDVADKILPMFDKKLGQYALSHFANEGVEVKTSHRIRALKRGFPKTTGSASHCEDVKASGFTLALSNGTDSEVGCGFVVWSTGLMSNPFVAKALGGSFRLPAEAASSVNDQSMSNSDQAWAVRRHERTGSVLTDAHLRMQLTSSSPGNEDPIATLPSVYAIGDCATMAETAYPATAQVAAQKAKWLASQLNKQDQIEPVSSMTPGFSFASQGVMAYIGRWSALVQLDKPKANVSGRAAWLMWRGAYLARAISWRNRILILVYWTINAVFGRDVSRF